MGSGSVIAQHVATCSRCASVAEELRYADYRLARALNEQQPGINASDLTVAVLDGSEKLRRKRIGRRIRIALMIAACGVFFVFMQQRTRNIPIAFDNSTVTTTIALKCLTPDQAMAIATPYLRASAGIWTVPDSRVITIRGIKKEIQRALSEIAKFDSSCQLPNPVATPGSTVPPK
jgi:hypothetical protein